jgi:hypothetical protein
VRVSGGSGGGSGGTRETVMPCEDPRMGYSVFRPGELEFQDRGDGGGRTLVGLSDRLTQTRARFWRYPPGARGRRHAEHVQEELFVVLEGAAAMLLGDPPERVELPTGTVWSPGRRSRYGTTAMRTCCSSSSAHPRSRAAPTTSRRSTAKGYAIAASASSRTTRSKVRSPFSASTRIVSPSWKPPSSSASESGFSTRRWSARLSGRAP